VIDAVSAVVDAVSEINRKEVMQADARDMDSSCESPTGLKHVVMCSLMRSGTPSFSKPSTATFSSVKGE
jgi:hypothetical protein